MSTEEDNKYLKAFVIEAKEHLVELEQDLLTLGASGGSIDRLLVNKIFQAIHSIKGGSGLLKLNTISNLALAIEEIINLIRQDTLSPTQALIDIILNQVEIHYCKFPLFHLQQEHN